MKYNTAGQFWTVQAFNSAGLVTGDAANITGDLALDNGTRTALNAGNPTEIGQTGMYRFALTKAETKGYEQAFTTVSSTPGVFVYGVPSNVIYTTLPNVLPNDDCGNLNPLFIGDDYTEANGRAIFWDFEPNSPDVSVANSQCWFGGSRRGDSWLVQGTLTDIGGGSFRASFDLTAANTDNLSKGNYDFSAELKDDNSLEETIKSGSVRLVEKQT